MIERDEYIAKLEAAHTFPGPYEFKLFGPNDDEFEAAVRDKVQENLPHGQPQYSKRTSGKDKHQCITVTAHVASAQKVVDLYAELHTIERLKMLM